MESEAVSNVFLGWLNACLNGGVELIEGSEEGRALTSDKERFIALVEEESITYGWANDETVPSGVEGTVADVVASKARWLRSLLVGPERMWWPEDVPDGGYQAGTFDGFPGGGQAWWTAPMRLGGTSAHSSIRSSLCVSPELGVVPGMPAVRVLSEDAVAQWTLASDPWSPAIDTGNMQVREVVIGSLEDFVDLVESYPLRVTVPDAYPEHLFDKPVEVVVDWGRLAQDVDVVYLKAEAYFECAWRSLPTRYGWTVMSGWSPETRFWISDESIAQIVANQR